MIEQWKIAEPGVRFVCKDLHEAAFGQLGNKLAALPHVVRNAGLSVLRPKGGFATALKRTQYYWDRLEAAAKRIHDEESDCDFGISIGTVLPIPSNSFPVFIYSDNTILTNLGFPDGGEGYRLWEPILPREKESIRRASRIFTMSGHVSKTLIESYGEDPKKVVWVGAGNNAPVRDSEDSERYRRRKILFVGLNWKRKGGPDLVAAFRLLQKRLSDATLTIVGVEPAGLEGEGIEVLGKVNREEVSRQMSSASVFAMPSLREPFGIVFVEAMQAGLPVVACRAGAPLDFVEDGATGYLVEPHGVEELAERLYDILQDAQRAKSMGERARERVLDVYTWAATQERMSAAINDAIGTSKPPALNAK